MIAEIVWGRIGALKFALDLSATARPDSLPRPLPSILIIVDGVVPFTPSTASCGFAFQEPVSA